MRGTGHSGGGFQDDSEVSDMSAVGRAGKAFSKAEEAGGEQIG